MTVTGRCRSWWSPVTVLVSPAAGIAQVLAKPHPWMLLAILASAWILLGLATVPRQVELLHLVLASTGEPVLDAQTEVLKAGLLRLIVADRLVPLPTVLVGGVLVFLAAEPVLMLPSARRRELLAIVAVGCAPLVVQRFGELAMTWMTTVAPGMSAGEVLRLPHRFASGAALFWRSPDPAPFWIELLEARVNMFALWSAALWAIGLHALEDRRWAVWQILLPFACLVAGGLVTWVLGPLVVAVVLRGLSG